MFSSDPDYENAIQLLCTIPGVKHNSAVTIISEIGIDMSQFCTSNLIGYNVPRSRKIRQLPLLQKEI